MTTGGIIITCIIVTGIFSLIFYMIGKRKEGQMVYTTVGLPKVFFEVIFTDSKCTLLRTFKPERKDYIVSTEVFREMPIRPKDMVRHTKGPKEMKELGITSLGYPPLVKCVAEYKWST